MARRYYDESYREPIELDDGTPVVLRLVGPEDKDLLVDGLNHMSSESRYRRFFSMRKQLTAKELAYLTEMDGENHLAVGALREHDDGREEGIGVARFARLPDNREQAEPAVAVVDEYHRRGLGTQLLQRLSAAAWERGIRWFRFEFLEENEPIHRLVESIGGPVRLFHLGQGVVAAEVPVPETRPGDRTDDVIRGHSTHAFLTHAASGRLSARLDTFGRLMLKHRGPPGKAE